MDNWTTFVETLQKIPLEGSVERLNNISKQFSIPAAHAEIIGGAATLILESSLSNKSSLVDNALATLSDLEKSTEANTRVDICYAIGTILYAYSSSFPEKSSAQITLLQTSSEFFQKVFQHDSNNHLALQISAEIYNVLARSADENKKMHFNSKSREIGQYLDALKRGEQNVKLSPSTYSKILTAYTYKDKATEFFKANDAQKALTNYHFAKNYITGLMDLSEEKEKEIKALKIVLLNNIAVCLLKLNKYDRALISLDEVLESDPDNVKALFRRGKCNIYLTNYEQASNDLNRALIFAPNDKEILHEIEVMNRKSKAADEKARAAYSKFTFDD
eukprot:gene17478-20854_t